ncbi:DUF1850 domain-containing protein [Desulfovibrio cuneatus]|uniref:DUF1850 domain-containing protein n=1 Tax=Desulfovibrio cuneatus TaxID=159728 RepID=UPI000402E25D|nr:DUF1850 domain-containing protein [Desulfovibrio cuneatus]
MQAPLGNVKNHGVTLQSRMPRYGTRLGLGKRCSPHKLPLVFLAQGALFFLLLCVCLALWPVPVIQASNQKALGFSLPAPLGQELHTRMIHSVQRTPVEEFLAPLHGLLWPWRTRIQSHNAGLPFALPTPGRFYSTPPWMILQGGRRAEPEVWYRVGTEELGTNEARVSPGGWHALYRTMPLARLHITVQQRPLWHVLAGLEPKKQ